MSKREGVGVTLTETEEQDLAVLEEQDIAFDPTKMALDLTKDEKRRTTALMLAIQAYSNLIIKDAEYLKEANIQARQGTGPVIQPATMDAMVEAALKFDAFISGRIRLIESQATSISDILRQRQAADKEPKENKTSKTP